MNVTQFVVICGTWKGISNFSNEKKKYDHQDKIYCTYKLISKHMNYSSDLSVSKVMTFALKLQVKYSENEVFYLIFSKLFKIQVQFRL